MKYISTGSIIINKLIYADGTVREGQLGGSAIFGLSALRLWDDDIGLVANVGKDFWDYYGPWMDQNGITHQGINPIVDFTNHHYVQYNEDGTYFEESIYGPVYGWKNFGYCITRPSDIDPYIEEGGAVYIASEAHEAYWDGMAELKRRHNFTLMWEIRTNECVAERREAVLDRLQYCDIFSLNKPESFKMFEVDTEEAAIEKIIATGVPCYYRVGKKGAYMIQDGKSYFIPTVHIADEEPDPTGCGNSSTAAAMYGFAKGYHPVKCGYLGAVTAAYNVLQQGPYPLYTDEIRKQANELVDKLTAEWKDQ